MIERASFTIMRRGLVAISCIAMLSCGASAPQPSPPSLVLQAHPTAAQFGEEGWLLSGRAGDAYYVHRDGDAWELEPHANTYGQYGTWMRSTDAAPFRGKRVRITIQARTRGAAQRVDVWSRAQGSGSPADGRGVVGDWKKLPADSDWQTYAMVFDVPDGAVALQYGMGLAGPGTMWMRDPKLEIVGTEVAVTATGVPAHAASECIAASTGVTLPVAFEHGFTWSADPRDVLTVESISGDHDTFVPAGTYRVRGHYTLASRPEAVVAVYVTSDWPGQYDGHVNSKAITQGSGEFDLTLRSCVPGYPHVALYPTGSGGQSFATTYFGSGATLYRR